MKSHREELFITGKTKNATYALPREIQGVPFRLPIYTIDPNGKGINAGTLISIHPGDSFYWESNYKGESKYYAGLPYFLEDLRPGGYLGALIPRMHPELEAPQDVNKWSTNQCLRYLTRFGSDLIGNYILGENAYSRFLEQQEKASMVSLSERLMRYEASASNVLALGDPGSSAAGEQPKFLITKEPFTKVIVKFSAKKEDARAHRQADLLWCESLALQVLQDGGFEVAIAEVLEGKTRTFLEVQRFDRVGKLGRKAQISLRALDLEFAGKGEGWIAASEVLWQKKKISEADFSKIKCLDLFGALIANNDRHLGNLSFFSELDGKFSLAPVYDMLPMLYNPKIEIMNRDFIPPSPTPSQAASWRIALPAAMNFWKLVSKHKRITSGFREIALQNYESLARLKPLVNKLPI